MAYIALEKLHRLYDGYRQQLRLAGRDLLLFQEDGKVHLIANCCPHRQSPLHQATVVDNCLRCPAHGIEFDLRTGQPRNAPGVGSLEYQPLVWQGNTVGMEWSE